MTKKELIEEISFREGVSRLHVERFVNVFLNIVSEKMAKKEKVNFSGFGSFVIVKRKKKVGRNPSTGERVDIPEKNILKFIPSEKIISKLN